VARPRRLTQVSERALSHRSPHRPDRPTIHHRPSCPPAAPGPTPAATSATGQADPQESDTQTRSEPGPRSSPPHPDHPPADAPTSHPSAHPTRTTGTGESPPANPTPGQATGPPATSTDHARNRSDLLEVYYVVLDSPNQRSCRPLLTVDSDAAVHHPASRHSSHTDPTFTFHHRHSLKIVIPTHTST